MGAKNEQQAKRQGLLFCFGLYKVRPYVVHGSLRRPAARGGASHAFQEQVRGGTCDTTLLLCIPVVSAVKGLA